MFTGTRSSLLLLFTISMFLAASKCSDNDDAGAVIELQRCQIRCLEKDFGPGEENLCLVQCHESYVNEENGQNTQIDQYEEHEKGQEKREQRGWDENLQGKKKKDEKEEKKERKEENPYYFDEQRFESSFKGKEGSIRVLERFSEKSELLNGIDNYRLATLEANPSTFMIPHHSDADSVLVVTNGQGNITFVHQQYRAAFYLQRGDAVKIPAGSIVYLVNSDSCEKLQGVILYQPINTPGQFEEFYGAGGQDPQSFYRVFSNELLEAALNVPKDKFDRVIGKYKRGIIVKASQEQIRALIQDQGQGGIGPQGPGAFSPEGPGSFSPQGQGDEAMAPFNILQQPPLFANELGQFLEATPNTHEQLRQLDISVAFMNINPGAMIVPYYNTRATKVVVVLGGKGYFEIACPHVARRSQGSKGKKEKEREKRSTQYRRVSARLSAGDVFIIPAGHPVSIVSSGDENLLFVSFGINARYNDKHFLAGGVNIWYQVPPAAKELSFEREATEVDEVFGSQPKSFFVPGPSQSQRKGEKERGSRVPLIMDLVDFM